MVRTITVRVTGSTVSATNMMSPSKPIVTERGHVDFHVLADADIARDLLRHIADHPNRREVRHLK